MAAKYKEFVQLMYQNHELVFAEFRKAHDAFALDADLNQEEFNRVGSRVQTIMLQWEDKLCGRSEGNGYGQYSGNLAQKFRDEIKKDYPLIEEIGVKRTIFTIKKITPSS